MRARPTGRLGPGDPDGRLRPRLTPATSGIAQGLEAAVEPRHERSGDELPAAPGGRRPEAGALQEMARRLPPGAVEFRDLVPPAEAARLTRGSDALLVPLDAIPSSRAYVPSKLFDAAPSAGR